MANRLQSEPDRDPPVGREWLIDAAVLAGFVSIAAALLLLGGGSIVLLVTFVVAFSLFVVRYVPGVRYDGPDKIFFLYYFVAVGLLIVL